MKVLFYNWTPLNTSRVGGGVAVYMQNILDSILSNQEKYNITPVFLSSGYLYDNSKIPYIRKDESIENLQCFSIINSPIIAPTELSVCQLPTMFSDTNSKKIFKQFIDEYGPFHVIHFQTLEGIAPNVLELKNNYKTTKFILSIHDYGVICSNVRLWTSEKKNCFEEKIDDCINCMKYRVKYSVNDYISTRPSKAGTQVKVKSLYKRVLDKLRHTISRKPVWASNDIFIKLREYKISLINQYVDEVLCVSKRVGEILESYGVDKSKITISYIGTKAADNAMFGCRTSPNSHIFTILYMGYAVQEKGFFVLLDALENINNGCKKITVKLASQIKDPKTKSRINKLKKKFNDIIIYDGYTHSDFPEIMKDVNLGIVPPQWEDNLPQVTIEMIANGIPTLTSSKGGAQELNSHPKFVFNKAIDLGKSILEIYNNRSLLLEYWEYSNKLTTMDDHLNCLIKIYNR